MKNKIRITSTPKSSNPKSFQNYNEMDEQYKGNNPLKYKNKTRSDPTETNVGLVYPSVPEDYANVEAEKGEVIQKNDGKLYKINGDPHSKGGTNIHMEDKDFIFSNNKDLTLSGEIVKLEFGLNPNKVYTFADIAKQYLSVNKFEKLKTSSDPLERKTADLMLQKLNNKLEKLSLLQEARKQFTPSQPEEGKEMFSKGGLKRYDDGGPKIKPYGGDKKNKFNASMYSEDEWTSFAKNLGFQLEDPTFLQKGEKEQITDFQNFINTKYPDIVAKHHSEKGVPYGGVFDGLLGYRWDLIKNDISATLPGATPTQPNGQANPNGDAQVGPQLPVPSPKAPEKPSYDLVPPSLKSQFKSEYRDLGYSKPEHASMANALFNLFGMPINEPTRYENYGLQQSLGMLSNVTPYNLQSSINEANKTASLLSRSNESFSPNAQIGSARNAQIAGNLAEATSKIKGQEYNQNAELFNNVTGNIANVMGAIGADKMQNAMIYTDKINQLKENLFGNKVAARKAFLLDYANAEKNRQLRNTVDYYLQSVAPNYKMKNADMAFSFSASENPFGYISTVFGGSPSGGDLSQDIANMQVDYQTLKRSSLPDAIINGILRKKYNLNTQVSNTEN